ncbi:MAG TPA: GNAT family N-acetyltransferase [Pyrinomonadaceae bacterium]|nr:GNAT family N-acetyltransferase [Pyrinomonadaceae bacterium]
MIASNVSLRPATADDEAFLRKLFTSTRIDEFKFLADPGQLDALISMQFNLQRQQYAAGYPDADHNIILQDGQPIGRLFVNEGEREFTLVDVALLPECRNRGIGRYLLDQLLAKARIAEKAVRLHVVKMNPARHLYERLGFSIIGEDGLYFEMICEAGTRARKD